MRTDASDWSLEEKLGKVLNAGGIVSTLLLAAGLAAFFMRPGHRVTDGLLNAGLLLLLATPVARVAVAATSYVQRGNWLFASLALTVLAVLVAGIIVAAT
jgi:uncharacterized membrane protein